MTHLYFHLRKYGFFVCLFSQHSVEAAKKILMMIGIVKPINFLFIMRKRNTYETYM